MARIGIIGGSGLYEMKELEKIEHIRVSTPFGDPSDEILKGELKGATLLFLPRHGRGHRFAPHRINFRANLFALKSLGVEQIISVSAVGSLKENLHPGEIVLVDQFIDRTRSRPSSFFEDQNMVVHVEFADPVDSRLQDALYSAARKVEAKVHKGGIYVCIEGPQFSTRAESRLFRSWGADVVGMTNVTEARLAREAEIPYATLAMVTDYDCWHETEEDVTIESVLQVLRQNVDTARRIIATVLPELPDPRLSPATSALKYAIITAPEHVDAETRRRLGPIIGKYLPAA
jgi:5'-methylthioadenosine phosphorylase